MKQIAALLTLFLAGARAFAPPRPVGLTTKSISSSSTELPMIGGLIQGIFGKKDAEVTDTVYFDLSIDGKPSGRIEMGLYGSTVPKVGL
jgi:hypothetical protein